MEVTPTPTPRTKGRILSFSCAGISDFTKDFYSVGISFPNSPMNKNVSHQTEERCFHFIQMKKVHFNFSLFFNNLVFIMQKENLVRVCSSVGFDIMKCSNNKRVFQREGILLKDRHSYRL